MMILSASLVTVVFFAAAFAITKTQRHPVKTEYLQYLAINFGIAFLVLSAVIYLGFLFSKLVVTIFSFVITLIK